MTGFTTYLVDDHGGMRVFGPERACPTPEGAAELGWSFATKRQIENFAAGWPINTGERINELGEPPLRQA